MRNPALDVELLLRSLGASGKLKGFQYVVYMIECVVEEPKRLELITKDLYRETAHFYNARYETIERNTRTVIRSCWNYENHVNLDALFGRRLIKPPTSKEFIEGLAAFLRRKERGQASSSR